MGEVEILEPHTEEHLMAQADEILREHSELEMLGLKEGSPGVLHLTKKIKSLQTDIKSIRAKKAKHNGKPLALRVPLARRVRAGSVITICEAILKMVLLRRTWTLSCERRIPSWQASPSSSTMLPREPGLPSPHLPILQWIPPQPSLPPVQMPRVCSMAGCRASGPLCIPL